EGCIMGAGMKTDAPLFRRRSLISGYARGRINKTDIASWEEQTDRFQSLDLSRSYADLDQCLEQPAGEEITEILHRMGKFKPEDELNCGACGYYSCREHAVAILKGLAESEMCLPYTIDRLNVTVGELAQSNKELADTQDALMQSERLASMGHLAAGIAHEVNNPLGVVLMYAHLMLEDLEEESRLKQDAKMIVDQADRCKKIVAGLLHFARQNKVLREPIDIRELMDKGCSSVVRPKNVTIEVEDTLNNPVAELDREQILQVLTNLISNACAAMDKGGKITITARDTPERISISVRDTGVGIPPENQSKIFEPFFTTKQIGKGTGLGLAVTYGIIKMHCGEILVESNSDPDSGPTGTIFTINLPRKEI
ncbi:MAG: ATP-binding protein, partial [Candidatus Auribacterota bacterium]|nr:ATP-binding protein [Candidatus Auribacterota bacterium]